MRRFLFCLIKLSPSGARGPGSEVAVAVGRNGGMEREMGEGE